MSNRIAYIRVHDNTNLARAIQEELFDRFDESEIQGWFRYGRSFWKPSHSRFDYLGITSTGLLKHARADNLADPDAPKFDVKGDWEEIFDHIRNSLAPNVPNIGGETVEILGPDSVKVGCTTFDRETAEEILDILRQGYSKNALRYARKALGREVQTEYVERVLELMEKERSYGQDTEEILEDPPQDSAEEDSGVFPNYEVGQIVRIDNIIHDGALARIVEFQGDFIRVLFLDESEARNDWRENRGYDNGFPSSHVKPVQWIPAEETDIKEGDILYFHPDEYHPDDRAYKKTGIVTAFDNGRAEVDWEESAPDYLLNNINPSFYDLYVAR